MQPQEAQRAPLVRATGVSKRFQATNALVDIDVELAAGDIHALVGANGVGKSTFSRRLSGRIQRGTTVGTLFGSFIAVCSPNGLNLRGINPRWQGTVTIAAVLPERALSTRRTSN